MNKLIATALVAGGLMLMNSPEAAAHKEVRNVYQPPAYHHSHARVDLRRTDHMPRWLKRDKSFRNWYRNTPVKRNQRLDWHQLFDIYRWERQWGRAYYRSNNYWDDYYAHRYGERRYDRDRDRHDNGRRRH